MTSTPTYKRGDPDPTPDADGHSGDCPAWNGGFICTWPAGHDGDHVAGMGPDDKIAHVWPQDGDR